MNDAAKWKRKKVIVMQKPELFYSKNVKCERKFILFFHVENQFCYLTITNTREV